MSRWNENPAWKEFLRWLGGATALVYIICTLLFIFFLVGPMAETVCRQIGIGWLYHFFVIIFRLAGAANLGAVIYLCLKLVKQKPGEWPN